MGDNVLMYTTAWSFLRSAQRGAQTCYTMLLPERVLYLTIRLNSLLSYDAATFPCSTTSRRSEMSMVSETLEVIIRIAVPCF